MTLTLRAITTKLWKLLQSYSNTDYLTEIIKIIEKAGIRKDSSKRWAPLPYYLERRTESEMKIQMVLYSLEHVSLMSS